MITLFFALNLLLFVITGIVTSYGDVYRKKVESTWVTWAFRNGLLIYGIFLLISLLHIMHVFMFPFTVFQLRLFLDILINTLIAGGVAILLWYSGIWAAGDSKLFLLYSFLIPLPLYERAMVRFFPSFILLVNVFIPVLVYVTILFLLHCIGHGATTVHAWITALRKDRPSLVKSFRGIDWAAWGWYFLNLQMLFWVLGFVQPVLSGLVHRVLPIQALCFVIMLLGNRGVQKVLQVPVVRMVILPLFILMVLIGIFYEPNQAVTALSSSLRFSISWFMLIGIINYLFESYVEKREVTAIPVQDLRPHMLLALRSAFVLQRDKKYFQKNIHKLYPDGLLPEQVAPVKKWFSKEGIKTVEIYKTFPFAPFLFLGGIITMAFRGSPFIAPAVHLTRVILAQFGIRI